MNLRKLSKSELRRNEPLDKHTSFGIGGPADYFACPSNRRRLAALLEEAGARRLKVRVIGAGSNLLVSDRGVRGLVISLSAPAFCRIRRSGVFLRAGAGLRLNRLIAYCQRKGLTGAEFLWGIPGTLGGALVMNAGISVRRRGRTCRLSIGDLVETVTIMHYNGEIRKLTAGAAGFGYRTSRLRGCLVLQAQLRLKKAASRKASAALLEEYRRARLSGQETGGRSAGCVFKNPSPGVPAGKLIDQCGCKTLRCGSVSVSAKHANFIIAQRAARASQVRRLMRLIQERVKRRFGLNLEPEIELWQ